MKAQRYKYAILIVNSNRFVTKIGESKQAFWSKNEEALLLTNKQTARDIAWGLSLNGNTALVCEIPEYISCLKNSEG